MWSINRILVAIKDPMACSLPAVAKATQLARAFDADLELFHAIDSSVYVDMADCNEERALHMEHDERIEYLQRLERIASRVRLHAKKVTVAAEWDFPGYEAIVRRAECTGAGLIVAECHAGPRFASAFRRLSDGRLLRLSPVPVLLVRGSRPYYHPTILTAVDPSCAFEKPRELDEEILCVGALLSKAFRGQLHAVHAYVPTRASDLARATGAGLAIADVRPIEAKVRFDRLLKGTSVLPEHRHLIGDHPVDGVRTLARRLKAEIVVAGAVSRAGLQRLLIGNTAERLLNSLPCDLLVVKPAGISNRVAIESHGPRIVSLVPPC